MEPRNQFDQIFLPRYEIVAELGRGGSGRVVKALDTSLQRSVAIKTILPDVDPQYIERITREARAVASLSHPNIVAVYEMGQVGDSAFIVMEYIEGGTLEKRLRETDSSHWSEFVPVLGQCADALDYAHRRGIVHRDIKPSNIIIRDDGLAKILDFGIATATASQATRLTQSGTFVGTPLYMAPEQIFGDEVGPRADQYSLGVIAFTILTRRNPYAADQVWQLIRQITQDLPPVPSTLDPTLSGGVDAVLLKALSKDPAKRFGSCRELTDALDKSLELESVKSTTPVGSFWSQFKRILDISRYSESAPAAAPPPTPSASAPLPPPPLRANKRLEVPLAPRPVPPTPLHAQQAPAAAQTEVGSFTQLFKGAEQTSILRKSPAERLDPETLARAQARDLIEILERRDFESAVALRGKWLPGIEAPGELIGFSEAARYLGAAENALSPHVRIEHLKRAEKVLFTVGNQLLAGDSPASRYLPEALEAWKGYARALLAAAQQKASSELPNPFRAGQPLRPDQGRSVFRGRTHLVRQIEAILADAEQNSSLALLGPRRCGKTSLLQMLPAMLPDCACVFFDLQDNPVNTVEEFFEALVRRAGEQVRAQRRIELPGLEGRGTFEAATRWFDQLDSIREVNRFLISIDEFERLEDLFPGDRRDLLRLMGLFRAVIQHRHRVRLLVSGVAPFEELGSLWNDHFINVRELQIGHLDEQTSIDLIAKPIPEFPEDAVPLDVAARVFERTAGQPYLLQLYGTLLVNRLNEMERTRAILSDVEFVEQDALTQGRYYFGNTYQDAPKEAREVLASLSRNEAVAIAPVTGRWLKRRWLLNEQGGLRTPALGAFIRQEQSG